jgi:hypothetical protein
MSAIMIRPLTLDVTMITTNAVESYTDVDYHVLFNPETQHIYTIYNYGNIVRDADNNRLFQSIVPDYQRLSCTMTNANPIVVTSTAHGLANGDMITFIEARGGDTIAEDVRIGSPCWVRNVATNTFEFANDRDEDSNSVGVILGDPGSGVAYFRVGDTNSAYWNPTVPPGDDTYSESLADLIIDLGDVSIVSPRWLDLGPDNAMAMFDGYNNTTTTFATTADVTIDPGARFDALGMTGLVGAEARVVINDGVSDVYDETYSLINNGEVVDYYSFFFGYRGQIASLVVDDLPTETLAPVLTVTGPSAIGNLSIGKQFEIGGFQYGLDLGSRSFSTIAIDETFGNYAVTRRRTAKRAIGQAMIENTRIDPVKNVLDAYDGIPVFWRIVEGYDATIIFGFYRAFNIEVRYLLHSLISYEIEGVI